MNEKKKKVLRSLFFTVLHKMFYFITRAAKNTNIVKYYYNLKLFSMLLLKCNLFL